MSSIDFEALKERHQGKDRFTQPDFYQIDDLLTEEHILIRNSVRDWVKRELSPIIEECAQKAEFPHHIIKGLGEIGAFGARMYETHMGLSKLYEVSCPELDLIVENCIPAAAIIGARMMGGGFGGCVIALVKTSEVDAVYSDINAIYEQTFGQSMGKYVMQIGDGTTLL